MWIVHEAGDGTMNICFVLIIKEVKQASIVTVIGLPYINSVPVIRVYHYVSKMTTQLRC